MPIPATILVTGGTGGLGRLVVPGLLATGRTVRILSRTPGESRVVGDLNTGAGLADALDGVETVVHLAGAQTGDGDRARTLVAAGRDLRHIVHISVVGAGRVPVVSSMDRRMFGYIDEKRDAEEMIAGSSIPWTTLRATQFHDLMLTVAQAMAKLPVIPLPRVRVQPVAAAEVAARLVELTLSGPAGLVPDLGGPRVHTARDLLRTYLRAVGKRRLIVPLPLGGRAYQAFAAGANITPDHADGKQTWEDFLATTLT